jgi:Zn-dependent alcohol dehydrogenase
MPTPARVVVVPPHPGPLEVQDVTLPDPGPHQVVVKLLSSGVCHSQLHQMHAPRQNPVVLGHEATGTVMAAGRRVNHVREGDTAIVTWVPRNAPRTRRRAEPIALRLADGSEALSQNVFTWADHTLADEQFVVKVPSTIQKDVTAIIGCAVITGAGAVKNTAGVRAGQSVAVFGVGGVGLSAIAAARQVGASPIIAVDLSDQKLEFAQRFGATHRVNASEGDPVQAIRDLTTGEGGSYDILGRPITGVDYAFDCIGLKITMEQIVAAARSGHFGAKEGGTAVLVGVPGAKPEINALDLLVHEKKFIGSIGGSCHPDRDFPVFLDWHEKGILDLNALVTARYGLDQINEATHALENGQIFGRAILTLA